MLAVHIDGPARVRLHVPPPLDVALNVTEAGDGQWDMYHGDTLVASAWPAELERVFPGPDYYGNPAIFEIGTAGEMVHVEQLPDGRFNIVLRGRDETPMET